MKIIGCDFHPGDQQIAVLDLATGESEEKALSHERKEEVRAFYAGLEGSVRVGIEASGQSQWFERMLTELGHQVWIGEPLRPPGLPECGPNYRKTMPRASVRPQQRPSKPLIHAIRPIRRRANPRRWP